MDDKNLLIAHCADVACKTNLFTPLHWASSSGHARAAAVLVESRAKTEARTEHGWTALHSAVVAGHGSVVDALLDHDADLEAKTSPAVSIMMR